MYSSGTITQFINMVVI